MLTGRSTWSKSTPGHIAQVTQRGASLTRCHRPDLHYAALSDGNSSVPKEPHPYYFPETTKAKGIAELIVAKQRNGPTGKVLLRFSASCTRFDNVHPTDYPEMADDE